MMLSIASIAVLLHRASRRTHRCGSIALVNEQVGCGAVLHEGRTSYGNPRHIGYFLADVSKPPAACCQVSLMLRCPPSHETFSGDI